MASLPEIQTASPCTQIQVDLSAMLDGELDPRSVLRVMMHSDACGSCQDFLDGIRLQVRSHRQLHAVLVGDPDQLIEVPTEGQGTVRISAAELRRQLTENREQLSRILYEIGRGFVLLGLSPGFSRVVSKDPASAADMFQRGRNLLDEVERVTGAIDPAMAGGEWLRAKQLFGSSWVRSATENLSDGTELLAEALLLNPGLAEARIYLGHAHHVAGDRSAACEQFREVLRGASADTAEGLRTRAFALLNLGNVHLEAGEFVEAEKAFLELVESGAASEGPHLGLTYFNLALTAAMDDRCNDSVRWLERLYTELPHKRRMIAEELRDRADLVDRLMRDPEVQARLIDQCPTWFPRTEVL